jgi:hypothetical protein
VFDSQCVAARSPDRSRPVVTYLPIEHLLSSNFVVVLSDWLSVKFDAAGNAKAAELVRQSPKGSEMRVEVTGNREKDKMKVSWISAAP